MKIKTILGLLILGGTGVLLYFLIAGIYAQSLYKERRQVIAAEIKAKLELIASLEKTYITQHEGYTAQWESLISFAKKGKIYVIDRKEIITPLANGTDSIVVVKDTINIVSVQDSLISSKKYPNLDINDLSKIPGSDTTFSLKTKKEDSMYFLEVKGTDPESPKLLRNSTEVQFQIGSMESPALKPNWEY